MAESTPSVSEQSLRLRHYVLELLMSFLIGIALMQYLYSATPDAQKGLPPALPGNDDFYHLKMALLLPTIGFPQQFQWLQHTIFADQFVSHHYGFHVYLLPFVHLMSDPVLGARWAMSVSFGMTLAAATWLLIRERVAHRWLWLALLLMLPDDFYSRHSYVRAIDLSTLLLLSGTACLFARRYVLLALTLIVYTHVYLGSFFLAIVAGIYWIGSWLGPKSWRDPWKLPLAVAAGSVVGLLTHPYGMHALGFLRTQIFESGLNPQQPVGREWYPYEHKSAWEFASHMGVPLTVLTLSIILRLMRHRRLDLNTWTMVVANFFFLVLMLRSRRFVEYWPLFAILASAMLSMPLLGRQRRRSSVRPHKEPPEEWPELSDSSRGRGRWSDVARGIPLIGLVPILGVAVWGAWTMNALVTQTDDWPWLSGACLLAGLYILLVYAPRTWVLLRAADTSRKRVWPKLLAGCGVATALATGVIGMIAQTSHHVHARVRHWNKGRYDLPEIQRVMDFIAERSNPGDIIFTDDWDIFPVFFYFNTKNHYMAGLDPMFSYKRDPQRWERYKHITQGRAPLTTSVSLPSVDESGKRIMKETRISVRLEDIRDLWGARWIIVDNDHRPFAKKLDQARGFARRVYPDPYPSDRIPLYTVYEVLPQNASDHATVTDP